MRRNLFIFGFLLQFFVFFNSCGGDDKVIDNPVVDPVPPALISMKPANNAENVSIETDKIILTFDKEVALVSPHNIQLNNLVVFTPEIDAKEIRISISLQKDTHYDLTIPKGKIQNKSGVAIDEEIKLSFHTEIPEVPTITENLVMTDPSPEAIKLYNFLKENYRQKIISGTMANVSWNINEAEWVYQHTGKYPALNGFDYIHLYASPANWIDYGNTTVVENWWNNKGIVTAGWHWNVPVSKGSSERAFYTSENSFDIREALKSGTWENKVINEDLEKISGYILLLQQKNIPVLWRPLHEAAGKWFWWGAKGAEPCRNLWIYMFDYFENKGINNLIWVWTAEPGDEEWYPGNEYVDIIGRDLYNKNSVAEYTTLQTRFPEKILALSEFGSIGNIVEQINSGAHWSWFMSWYDYERTQDKSAASFKSKDHGHANADWWTNAFSHPDVLSRDEMPNLK